MNVKKHSWLNTSVMAVIALLSCVVASAQSFSPRAITFDGAPAYASSALLGASGLAVGRAVDKAGIEAALAKLVDTGLFSDVQYEVANNAVHFHLQPVEAQQLLPVAYANLVFDTSAAWTTAVMKRVPLFNGAVPVHGTMQAEVERALEAALRDRGVKAIVQSTLHSTQGEAMAVEYMIVSPKVIVGALDIDHAAFETEASLAAVRARSAGQPYAESTSGPGLRRSLVEAYQDLGYLDVVIAPVTHGKARIAADEISVDLHSAVTEGPRYRIGKIALPTPAPPIDDAVLERATLIKTGAYASRVNVLGSIARLNEVYHVVGYLDAEVTAEPSKDAATGIVGYTFASHVGPRYRFRNLIITGLSEDSSTALRQSWKLPVGAAYNGLEVAKYLQSPLARTACGAKKLAATLTPERRGTQVDVTLDCR